MKTNPNDPINPVIVDGHGDTGLTKREYFAALAMQTLVAQKWQPITYGQGGRTLVSADRHMARTAIQFADALINELNEVKK